MAGPVFPDVPITPGVPAVNRSALNPGTTTQARLSSDSINVTGTTRDQWGIYTSAGALVLKADSVIAIGYEAEHRIADFPIEQGGFESYDKVALPEETRVVLTKGGSWEDRRAFLNDLDNVRSDLNLYSVITPERAYLNANIERVRVDRSREQGAGLITAEITLREIRQNATTTFTNTRDPASASPVNNGNAQAVTSTTPTGGVQ